MGKADHQVCSILKPCFIKLLQLDTHPLINMSDKRVLVAVDLDEVLVRDR